MGVKSNKSGRDIGIGISAGVTILFEDTVMRRIWEADVDRRLTRMEDALDRVASSITSPKSDR